MSHVSQKDVCHRGHPRTPENLRGRSCILCEKLTRKWREEIRREENPALFMLKELSRRARKRGKNFGILPEDIQPLPTHCPMLGVELDYSGGGGPAAASVDRVDSSIGYVPGNVVIISKRANTLKNGSTVDEMKQIVAYLESEDLKRLLEKQKSGACARQSPEFQEEVSQYFEGVRTPKTTSPKFASAKERRAWIRDQLK